MALTWFMNNKDHFNSWDTFKCLAVAAFSHREEYKQRAMWYLQSRQQFYNKPSAYYMADILNTHQKGNPDMAEAEKIRNLPKGLSQHLFNVVALTPFSMVAELNNTHKRYDEQQCQ